ncbi:hypothetical protein BDV96DRAFT_654867 [Lophiotrema nucula]|uniref:2EXR domain-containing protein n=1 Tax=Lophiotrema nucula TaxID=690887 RepID=A0A6A5YG94_9PLEO|nr:hypothetical protein BDV96DRAFT_654867 [Lophiotrema nucula]
MVFMRFPYFPQLPAELRDMIWERSLPAPPDHVWFKLINIHDRVELHTNPLPVALQATREARRIARIRGCLWSWRDDKHTPIYFDPDCNRLQLESATCEHLKCVYGSIELDPFLKYLPLELIPRIRHLDIRLRHLGINDPNYRRRTSWQQIADSLYYFHSLQSFHIQLDGSNGYYQGVWDEYNRLMTQNLFACILTELRAKPILWVRFVNLMLTTHTHGSFFTPWWYRVEVYQLLLNVLTGSKQYRLPERLDEEGADLNRRIGTVLSLQ